MQRPIDRPLGTPVEELDTPALIVDIGQLDANLARSRHGPDWAPDARVEAWVHKTPAIARRQLDGVGLAGIAVRSVGEAETFAVAGFDDIRILRPPVTGRSRERIERLRRSVRIVLAHDGPLWGEDCLRGAVTVSARVTSVPEAGLAIHDCGQKAVGRDFGDPVVAGRGDCEMSSGSAEHGVLRCRQGGGFALGDWLELVPVDVATVFSLHDFAYGVRDGVLEAVWRISARGAFS